jgi:hypothetical protein
MNRGPYKPPKTRAELRAQGAAAAANSKLSPEDNERIVREAIEGGQKWDVQEDINNRRQAEELARAEGHAQDFGDQTGSSAELAR